LRRERGGRRLELPFKKGFRAGLVVHACEPSCSRGRNQEDRGSKPALANSSRDLISKTPITRKGLVEWLKV
jgi:hypothetical protein